MKWESERVLARWTARLETLLHTSVDLCNFLKCQFKEVVTKTTANGLSRWCQRASCLKYRVCMVAHCVVIGTGGIVGGLRFNCRRRSRPQAACCAFCLGLSTIPARHGSAGVARMRRRRLAGVRIAWSHLRRTATLRFAPRYSTGVRKTRVAKMWPLPPSIALELQAARAPEANAARLGEA